jgi:hypothetical protein
MLSGMKKTELERRIRKIQEEMARLGRLRPGTLYSRLNVCGRPGCKCGRKKDPEKHGPYHYLSYTYRGRSHTEFVKERELEDVRREVRTYERLMELVKALVDANWELSRWEREETR